MSSSSRKKASDDSTIRSPTLANSYRIPHSASHHDLTQRPSPAARHRSRQGSTTSIASSIGGILDAAAQKTAPNTSSLAQNAISVLLSPPIVRTGLVAHTALPASSSHKAPTAKDIPPVTLTSIPHIEPSTFSDYLSQVGTVFESYQRAKLSNDEATASATTPHPEKTPSEEDEFSEAFARRLRSDSGSSFASTSRQDSPTVTSPASPNLRSPKTPRRGITGPSPLSTVPAVYFEENFKLENPRTFDVVSEYADVIPPDPRNPQADDTPQANGSVKSPAPVRRKALHTNAILQEKLSWYLDTVEVHLISSIATASTSFFTALESLKQLQSEAEDSTTRIRNLRATLQSLDKDLAAGGLEVVNMQRKRDNLRKLGQAVAQLIKVTEEAKRCEELLDSGNIEEAATAVDALEDLIAGDPRPGDNETEKQTYMDLRKLKALDGVSDGIFEIRFAIGKGFEARFIQSLLTDLREHVKAIPKQVVLQRWARTSFRGRENHNRSKSTLASFQTPNDNLRSELLSALAGLAKAGHTARAASAFRDAIMREIKSLIRQHLPSSSDDDTESTMSTSTRGGKRTNQQEKSSILARNLRALDAEAAEELLINIYTTVGEAMRRLGYQVKLLLDVTSSIDPVVASPGHRRKRSSVQVNVGGPKGEVNQIYDEVSQALDLSSLLGQAVDVVQTQVTKVLRVRTEQQIRVPLQTFLRYFALNRLFADECEAICGRPGDTLRDVVNSQIQGFLQRMAEDEKTLLSQSLEEEKWDAHDFGPEEAHALHEVLESMSHNPASYTQYTSLWQGGESNGVVANGQTDGANDNGKKTVRSAVIDEQKYLLVRSVHVTLFGVRHFSQLIAGIPSLAGDASNRMLEYLRFFNSRAVQLILGTGAILSTAKLKAITTKHLALASQACSFIIALVPYVREFVRRQAPSLVGSGGLLGEFDRLKRTFQDHQTSIHEKLVDIITTRSDTNIQAMKQIDYNDESVVSSTAVSQWAQELVKNTSTLNRVLARHVSEADLKMVMVPIFSNYSTEWGKAFEGVELRTVASKNRLMRDVEFMESSLNRLDGAGELGSNNRGLAELVREKPLGASAASRTSTSSAHAAGDPTRKSTEKG